MLPTSIPSPPSGVWHIGDFPVRGYALCILAGIVAAVWISARRIQRFGQDGGVVVDVATWAVPFGLVGARLYHLATSPQIYWGHGGEGTLAAFEIWHGGLGIWGGIAAGALGAWIGARRQGVDFSQLAWATAPAIPVAQAIGRWGNWFNQELYGRRMSSSLFWALHITHPSDGGVPGYYQPTFLYESIWDLGVALLVWQVGRRVNLSGARLFAVYVMAYTVGRAWIEYLRVDAANHFLGLRLNDWTCLVCFIAALVVFVVRRPADPGAAGGSGDDADGSPSADELPRSVDAPRLGA